MKRQKAFPLLVVVAAAFFSGALLSYVAVSQTPPAYHYATHIAPGMFGNALSQVGDYFFPKDVFVTGNVVALNKLGVGVPSPQNTVDIKDLGTQVIMNLQPSSSSGYGAIVLLDAKMSKYANKNLTFDINDASPEGFEFKRDVFAKRIAVSNLLVQFQLAELVQLDVARNINIWLCIAAVRADDPAAEMEREGIDGNRLFVVEYASHDGLTSGTCHVVGGLENVGDAGSVHSRIEPLPIG